MHKLIYYASPRLLTIFIIIDRDHTLLVYYLLNKKNASMPIALVMIFVSRQCTSSVLHKSTWPIYLTTHENPSRSLDPDKWFKIRKAVYHSVYNMDCNRHASLSSGSDKSRGTFSYPAYRVTGGDFRKQGRSQAFHCEGTLEPKALVAAYPEHL